MIIFDEKQYAEDMLRKGFATKKRRVYETFILAKYLFYEGCDEKKVKQKVIKFYEKWQEDFDRERYYNIINRTINYAKNSKLKTGKTVSITNFELDIIQSLDDFREQKLAFVMLVLYKFYGCRKFEVTLNDLFNLSELSNIDGKYRLFFLKSLTMKGLIDIDLRGRRMVNFANNKDKIVINIIDFDNFINEFYLILNHNKYKQCVNCFKAIYMSGKNTKYCKSCFRNSRILSNKKYNKKRLRQF